MEKPRIATCSLAGCFGCHMSFLDIDERFLELIKLVDFDRSPINDIKRFSQRCDIGLVEGGCCNEENVQTLQKFRKNCDVLISVGQCAINGGVPAMRNAIMGGDDPLKDCLEEAYLTCPTSYNPAHEIPNDPALPLLLDIVYPCHEVVKIDYAIPGCPPSADTLWHTLVALVKGEPTDLPYELLKYD